MFIFETKRLHIENTMRRDVFQAIADPTRRAILCLVADQTLNLNAVAEQFESSRPAISKHIKILSECGLIVIRKKGRERFCQARLGRIDEVSDWVDQYRKLWTRKLDSLENYVHEMQQKETPKKGQK